MHDVYPAVCAQQWINTVQAPLCFCLCCFVCPHCSYQLTWRQSNTNLFISSPYLVTYYCDPLQEKQDHDCQFCYARSILCFQQPGDACWPTKLLHKLKSELNNYLPLKKCQMLRTDLWIKDVWLEVVAFVPAFLSHLKQRHPCDVHCPNKKTRL